MSDAVCVILSPDLLEIAHLEVGSLVHIVLNFDLQPRTEKDESFYVGLFREVREPEFLCLGLSRQALDHLLTMQFRAQTLSYAAQFPEATDHVIWQSGIRVGRLLVDRSLPGYRLIDIALLPEWRGKGLGTQILQVLAEEARVHNVSLHLDVRPGNPAARLYHRLGFVATGSDGANLRMEFRPGSKAEDPVLVLQGSCASSVSSEPETSSAYFRTLIGQTVQARSAHGGPILSLTLASIESLRQYELSKAIEPGDSFVLRFKGPVQPRFEATQVLISHDGQSALGVFLVPVACTHERMEYEAIFNRAVRKAMPVGPRMR